MDSSSATSKRAAMQCLTGWVLLCADYFLGLSELRQTLLSVAWLAVVVIWCAMRPKIVIPKEDCAD